MRVLQVFDHSIPMHSGYAFRSLAILEQLRRSGIETIHVTSSKHYAGDGEFEHVDGYDFHRTPRSVLDAVPVANQWGVIHTLRQRIRQLVAEHQPALIHCHSPSLNALAAAPVARRAGIPLLYEMRASWEDAAVSHGTCKEGDLRYRLGQWLEKRALHSADHVATICQGLAEQIVEWGVDEENITVVPNAVDVDKFEIAAEKSPAVISEWKLQGQTVLGFLGSFYRYEGLHLVLDALPGILRVNPETVLLLVGGGPEEEALKRQVSELGLEDSVIFVGRVPHEQVPRYYSVIDIFVYPRESIRLTEMVTPLKPLEAMAQGGLVAASDIGGHREMIRDGENGVFFQPDDVADITRVINTLLADRESWAGISAAGRAYVEHERTWENSVARILPVYGQLARAS